MKSRKYLLPWYVKIVAKVLLSRLPLGYHFWKRLNLFVHGAMNKPDYAYDVFRQHFQRSDFARKSGKFVSLELGPGDSLLSAIVATAHGSSKCYLVDAGAFAAQEIAPYLEMADFLRLRNLPTPALDTASDLAGALQSCNAVYLTQGLNSLRNIPSESVDFIWSQAVLEHIRRHEFLDVMRELRRVLRPGGICSHRVDLKDHLGGDLNNLRFSARLWESNWVAKSGFYTNRLRYSNMAKLFKQAGFDVEIVAVNSWNSTPTPRNLMSIEFQGLSEEDLLVKEFDVLLRPSVGSLELNGLVGGEAHE
jgi:SAM-dependent methyltransferase